MTAIISACGQFRYRLERDISLTGPVGAVIMVNPSTADAETDDATIRRVIGFSKKLGWAKVIVGNVFAYRATDISVLARVPDPVGPDNARHLNLILEEADQVLVAWGTLAKLPRALRLEWQKMAAIAGDVDIKLMCLGTAKDGHPRHPLMLSYDSVLVEWLPPSV